MSLKLASPPERGGISPNLIRAGGCMIGLASLGLVLGGYAGRDLWAYFGLGAGAFFGFVFAIFLIKSDK